MTRAVFVAVDPFHRLSGKAQLKDLLADIHGLKDYDIDRDGQVTVAYDHQETSSNLIEDALAGVGYKVKHVYDDAKLGKADAPNLGVTEESGGKKYGK